MPLPHKAKIDRLSAELHHLRIASVKILRDIPGAEAFIDEVTAFPNGSNDDQVDALSQYLSFITEREASNQEQGVHPDQALRWPQYKGRSDGADAEGYDRRNAYHASFRMEPAWWLPQKVT